MNSDVFISYSSTYRQLVDALVHFLEEKQIKCWYAPRDIPHGIEYAEAIESAIANSKFFIILVSELSQKSNWCRSEVNLAVSLGKIILPVRIEEVELKSGMKLYLNHRHWLDAFPRPEEYFENVCNAILELKKNTRARKIGGNDPFKGTVDHNEITLQSNSQEASTENKKRKENKTNYWLSCFKKYAEFSVRARRQEFWMFILFNMLVYFGLQIVDAIHGTAGVLGAGYFLAALIPSWWCSRVVCMISARVVGGA